jgi:lysophospholipase L1-like esterase
MRMAILFLTTLMLSRSLIAYQKEFAANEQANVARIGKIKDVQGLPRVLVLGDSIAVGYCGPTRELLRGKANAHCVAIGEGSTLAGLQSLDGALGRGKWDVIHFNWGLNDLEQVYEIGKPRVSSNEYAKNLMTLIKRMKHRDPQATLIWCSTTPFLPGKLTSRRDYKDVPKYNRIAKKIMEQNNIRIDDLYSFALPQLPKIQQKYDVHFTKHGYRLMAHQVASHIVQALAARAKVSPRP